MNKIKKIILVSVLGAAFAFGVGATIQPQGCYGSYANGVGEIVECGN